MSSDFSRDLQLLHRALAAAGERTKKAAVTKALQKFIMWRKRRHVRDLIGQLEWDQEFDYKAERSRD